MRHRSPGDRTGTILYVRLAPRILLSFFIAALSLVGCSSPTATVDAADPALVDFTSSLAHVHGLHVNADGTVLAGSHTGLFAIDPAGNLTRVGSSDDDFMGLSGVPATDTLFTSGHPGESSTAANPLGLRRSDDGGMSWSDRSLEGKVDFHALTADERILIGFDGRTGLLVSADSGSTWSPGAAVPVASLAITNSGVWAITPDGLQYSTDTARTFSPVAGAPNLVLLAGAGNALWGIDTDGYAWRSRNGTDWQQRSATDSVEALTAIGYDTAYAASPQGLYTLT
ncbi:MULTISPECIES: F510_1955 family glycosylhydrolase [unclassified Rhodococcus (in: high G+C Gram-positive bacteria)]|uniref:F510_1955 family glycosylhydrolase n=1 Tax=unclassified Rhodococcus (in: high G+C Gram-positive bacteria) TaxID=192944 RepID=UPI0021C03292